MPKYFTIKDKETGITLDINEIIILDTIKSINHRNKRLADIWIDKMEKLTNKKFDPKDLEY